MTTTMTAWDGTIIRMADNTYNLRSRPEAEKQYLLKERESASKWARKRTSFKKRFSNLDARERMLRMWRVRKTPNVRVPFIENTNLPDVLIDVIMAYATRHCVSCNIILTADELRQCYRFHEGPACDEEHAPDDEYVRCQICQDAEIESMHLEADLAQFW